MYNKEKQLTSFAYMGHNVNKCNFFWAIWGALGAFKSMDTNFFQAGRPQPPVFHIWVTMYLFLAIRGGGGAGSPSIIRLGPSCFTAISSHLYQFTYNIWKQSVQDFLSYHDNDKVSVDVAGAVMAA